MRLRPSAVGAALALGALSFPAASAAQAADGFVLPFGMFRLGFEGTHATYESLFDAAGTRVPLASGAGGELTPDRFAAIVPLATDLTGFLEATHGGPGASPEPPDPATLSLGTLDLLAAGSRTLAAGRLSVGILPRLEIGASLPVGRTEHLVQRLELNGGTLGLNPDPEMNAALLAGIGWEQLGESLLLPTADSPLGLELQSRVSAITGASLALPTDTATIENLTSILAEDYGLPAIASRVEPWRTGDLAVHAKGLVLSTFGSAPAPVDSAALGFRVSVSAGARFPTGEEPDSLALLTPRPTERLSSISGGAAADLFLGPRLWITGSLAITRARSTEVVRRVAPPEAPLSTVQPPTTVTITPGDVTAITVVPRFRLTHSISLGLTYSTSSVGDTRYRSGTGGLDASVLDLQGGRLQRLGVEVRYSSLPAYWLRQASLPAEVILRYGRTLAGPEGAAAGGQLSVTASILPRIW